MNFHKISSTLDRFKSVVLTATKQLVAIATSSEVVRVSSAPKGVTGKYPARSLLLPDVLKLWQRKGPQVLKKSQQTFENWPTAALLSSFAPLSDTTFLTLSSSTSAQPLLDRSYSAPYVRLLNLTEPSFPALAALCIVSTMPLTTGNYFTNNLCKPITLLFQTVRSSMSGRTIFSIAFLGIHSDQRKDSYSTLGFFKMR